MNYIEKKYLDEIVDRYREEQQKLNTNHNDNPSFKIGDIVYYIHHAKSPHKCPIGKVKAFEIKNKEDLYFAFYGSACGWAFDNYEDAYIALRPKTSKLIKWVYQFLYTCLQKINSLEHKINYQQKQIEEYEKKIDQKNKDYREGWLEYKQFYTSIYYNATDKVLHGKIEGIKDLVNFESESAVGIEDEFHKAVDDYIEFCKEVRK